MISVEKCRQLIPNTKNLSEKEILQIRDSLYDLGQIALEDWKNNHSDSKNLEWLLPDNEEKVK